MHHNSLHQLVDAHEDNLIGTVDQLPQYFSANQPIYKGMHHRAILIDQLHQKLGDCCYNFGTWIR